MTVETAVRERLLAVGAVTALVGLRVWDLRLPQRPTLPAIRVQLVDDPTGYHLRGEDGITRARVQVDAVASGLAAAQAVADAVHAALSGQKFAVGSPAEREITGALSAGRRPLDDGEGLQQVRVSEDYIVWSRAVS